MNKLVAACRLGTLTSLLCLVACGGGGSGGGGGATPSPGGGGGGTTPALFREVTATNLPTLGRACMDVAHGDLDGDGDVDLVLAQEFFTDIVLRNDGTGGFERVDNAITEATGDNEDLHLGDFDQDGDLDIITVQEDTRTHALLLNDGSGTFAEAVGAIPRDSVANAVEVTDLDGDGLLDIVIGNAGPNVTLLNQPPGAQFVDETLNRFLGDGTTQELLLLDVDGDTDLDMFVANEADNALYINDGNGFFADETAVRLPAGDPRETREVDAADVDNDGDLDLVVANVQFSNTFPRANQLLLNDGAGVFTDVTDTAFAGLGINSDSFTVKFVDVDRDGDPDIISPRNQLGAGGSVVVWINDGTGVFANPSDTVFDASPDGSLFDVEVADFNGDGLDDLYLCHRTGTDQLYFGQ
jgi:hypothetical protein